MPSTSLVYTGAHTEVEVPEAPGVIAQRDVPVDVPEEIATRLLQQSTWSEAKKPAKSNAKDGK